MKKAVLSAEGDGSDDDMYVRPEDVITYNVLKNKRVKAEPTNAPPVPTPSRSDVEYLPNDERVPPTAPCRLGMNGWSSEEESDGDASPGGGRPG